MFREAEKLAEAQRYARGTAARILRQRPDDVDDVLQNAAIKALRFQGSFRRAAKYKVWFTRIVINEALMLLRRGRSRTFVDIQEEAEDGGLRWELPSVEPSPEVLAVGAEVWAVVRDEVSKMTPRRQEEARRLFLGEGTNRHNARKTLRFRVRQLLKARLIAEGMGR